MQISTVNQQFAMDVAAGLSASPKSLPAKYFYDKRGDYLFQQIMELEEYYPTRCEYEIFDTYKHRFLELFQHSDRPFQLLEFGAGDGYKTKVLLDAFTAQKANFQYIPIDISNNVLQILAADFKKRYPDLNIAPFNGDYFKALEQLSENTAYRKVVVFMGSNIGNFTRIEAVQFLRQIYQRLAKDDLLLIGIDLKKYPQRILDAYNDKKGITRDFNYNLLLRINKELGGNFKLENFLHSPTYNPQTGDAKSYLVATKDHEVYIEALEQTFHFEAWEAVYTEISKKYSISGVENLAKKSGFEVVNHFFDQKKYFVDSIWRKA